MQKVAHSWLPVMHQCQFRLYYCMASSYGSFSWWFSALVSCEVKVIQSFLTLCDPMDYIVHGILQARILEWVAFPFSRASSQPRDQTLVSCIAGGFFTSWATREALVSCNSLYCEYLQFESTWFLLRSCSQPSFERSKFCFFRFFIILIVVRMEWQLLRGWKAKRKSCYNFFIIIPALVSSCQLEIQGFRLIFFLRFLKCVFSLNLFFFSIKEFFFLLRYG